MIDIWFLLLYGWLFLAIFSAQNFTMAIFVLLLIYFSTPDDTKR